MKSLAGLGGTAAAVLGLLALAGCGTPPGYRGVAVGMVSETVSVYYATDRAAESRSRDRIAPRAWAV